MSAALICKDKFGNPKLSHSGGGIKNLHVLFREKPFRAAGAGFLCSRSEKIEIFMLLGNSFSRKHSL